MDAEPLLEPKQIIFTKDDREALSPSFIVLTVAEW